MYNLASFDYYFTFFLVLLYYRIQTSLSDLRNTQYICLSPNDLAFMASFSKSEGTSPPLSELKIIFLFPWISDSIFQFVCLKLTGLKLLNIL